MLWRQISTFAWKNITRSRSTIIQCGIEVYGAICAEIRLGKKSERTE